ncbi:MAG: acyl-CoA dehydrogenase family protein [Opitutaceae bacterium]|nr:acyl-CoA dehydrogenase family protein [Opitutaceae bacterium]
MKLYLTTEQQRRSEEFQAFAATHVAPHVAEWDSAQEIPRSAILDLGRAGYLGATLPTEYGGQDWDTVTFGLLNEALGRHDSAYTGFVTVHAMISMALLKWGTAAQRREWLPPLSRGEKIGAIALTEPAGGSDLNAMTTRFTRSGRGDELILNGEKKWISGGQAADVFLIFGKVDEKPVACLVPRESVGLEVEPIRNMLGFRAAGMAGLRFHDVPVPGANMVGKPGFAFSHVVPVAMHFGRISTACSALGLLRGCFEESTTYAATRSAGAQRIGDLGMIQSMIARMGVDLEATKLLCWSACRAKDEHRPESYTQALMAKYFSSRAAVRAAADAIQIHGAAGCHESSPVARFFRASKIMEMIEGTTQVHEHILGRGFVEEAAGRSRPDISHGSLCQRIGDRRLFDLVNLDQRLSRTAAHA